MRWWRSLRHVPGLVDLRLGQVFNQPELRVATDRSRAQQLGISQHDVANNLLLTLSGSGQIAPTFWLNPETGLQYPLVAQAPQYRMTSLQDLQNLPVTTATGQQQILGGLATISRGFGPAVIMHRDAQPIIDIFGAAQDRDLGAIDKDIKAAIAKFEGKLPKGTHITVRGQVQTMTASYTGLAIGFIGAIVLVYLLIVINFQSWTDPFIIITALARRRRRHCLDAVDHGHHAERACADRRDHVYGCGHRQQHPGGELRAGSDGAGRDAPAGRARCRLHPLPAGVDDGARDDHRHVADVPRHGRGWRAERAARAAPSSAAWCSRRSRRSCSCRPCSPRSTAGAAQARRKLDPSAAT